ncbi:J domain-containing protein [Hymenobacter edaphi]|uniref:J domain-containing protein n=1 Tax=Hymenobacter edaphi TaxID=2211146 RepID=UPI001402C20C|nr:J domain-containing protein [Hymenobacter edaphi]
MTTYYQILELPEQATAADVRRAYLRLVRLTHPDRTPDPAAHRRYLLINEAYDTLRQPALRAHYDAQLRARRQPARPAYTAPFAGNAYQVLRVPYSATEAQIEQAYQHWRRHLSQGPAADPALQQQRRHLEHAYATLSDAHLREPHDARVRGQRPPRRAQPYAALYGRYARAAQVGCWLLLAFFLLLLLDCNLTVTHPEARVAEVEMHVGNAGDAASLVRTQHSRFWAQGWYEPGARIDVQQSRLFNQVRAYRRSRTNAPFTDYSLGRAYGLLFCFPLAMGACAAVGVWPRNSAKRTVDFAIASALTSLVVVYLLNVT